MGFLLLLPFFLIRFGLLALLDKGGIRRAAHFAPVLAKEKPALVLYQLSNLAIFPTLCFLRIRPTPGALFYSGIAVLCLGTALLAAAIVGFAAPSENGIKEKGIYRFSRNPMYVAYFVYFTGCVLLTQSLVLLALLIVFQASSHWIILSEERWCLESFGADYRDYMQRVRRYL